LASDFLEESSVADAPLWYDTDDEEKGMARHLREEYERVTSDHLLVVNRASNGVVAVQALILLINESYQYLSDEAVESIGKEDYVRMVACLGQHTTDNYFRGGKSSLT
jgi:hypothetical protein